MKLIVSLAVGLLASLFMEVGGFILGCIVGYLLWEQREMANRLRVLEAAGLAPAPAAPGAAPAPAPDEAVPAAAPVARQEPAAPPADAGAPARHPEARAAWRGPLEAVLGQVKAFVFGGNTLVRLGLVVLFFGLSFLVKYAVDNAFFPVELRLAAAAAAGAALAGFGWRLRTRRPEFALALQGGGTAVLYLTIFASYRLYGFLPSGAAFGLLVATTVLGAVLALLQNAQTLAVLSLLGGFFAPVLASTGAGSHVALFGYYAVLNAGVLVLAWRRAWRPLHLVGFFCTFGIAGLWVSESYTPDLFATTEPFLALFFLCYFAVAVLQARHRGPAAFRPVDGTLVFGLPVVVFSLQAVLVAPYAYGLAWSAFVLGCFYAAAAYALYRRAPLAFRLLVESFAGVGLALGTMVLPFALDATWTGTGWALEGAALVWLGFRQARVLLRLSGVVLQVAAAVSFVDGWGAAAGTMPFLNAFFFGCLALSVSALGTAYLVQHHRAKAPGLRAWEGPIEGIFLAAGLGWWLLGGSVEIDRAVADVEWTYHLAVALVAATGLGCALLRVPLAWRGLRVPALLVLPALALMLLPAPFVVDHPFASGGFLAWPFGVAAHVAVLRRTEVVAPAGPARWLHAGGLWLAAAVLAWEGTWMVEQVAPAGTAWPLLAAGLVPVLLVLLVTRLAGDARPSESWPFGAWREAYLVAGVLPLVAAAWYWSVYAGLTSSADPGPLPYLPLANPFDLVLGLGVVAGVGWFRALRRRVPSFGAPGIGAVLAWVVAGTMFFHLNVTIARTVHAWGGVRYDLEALLASTPFQTALTIVWTALAVTAMAVAARRGGRPAWMAAATLLGITVVKLFTVDLSSIGTVARIFTFLVVGLLLLVVGYLAPVPPQHSPSPEVERPDEPVETPV